jgi:hypothetical protein
MNAALLSLGASLESGRAKQEARAILIAGYFL